MSDNVKTKGPSIEEQAAAFLKKEGWQIVKLKAAGEALRFGPQRMVQVFTVEDEL